MTITTDGYYNRYPATGGFKDRNYKRALFRSGRGLQSAEANEIHDYAHDNFFQYIDALRKNGKFLQSGLAFVATDFQSVFLEAGTFIAEGYIVDISSSSVSLPTLGIGTFDIGVSIHQSVVTESTDPDLNDPAENTFNFGTPGAAVLRFEGEWVLESAFIPVTGKKFYPVHRVIDGVLQVDSPIDTNDEVGEPVKELVAAYDRDAVGGDYAVHGMKVKWISDDTGTQEHILNISSGNCHVYGYRIVYANDRRTRIDWATDERFVNNEPVTITGVADWYTLRNTPISRMTGDTFATLETTNPTQSKGVLNGADILGTDPLVSIQSVTQGASTYTSPADWIQTGDTIDWSPGGSEPASSSTYSVTYRYTKTGLNTTISDDYTQIKIDEPTIVVGGACFIDYYYYLPRWDTLCIKQDGDPVIVKGVPDDIDRIVPPDRTEGLPIANIRLEWNEEPYIESDVLRVYQAKDIQRLEYRLDELQYNFMRLSQIQDVSLKDSASNKKNMFVDPFYDTDLTDENTTQSTIIMDGILTPGMSWVSHQVRVGPSILLDSDDGVYINQDSYTKTRKVNEMDYAEIRCEIGVSPKSLRWLSSTVGTKENPSIVIDEDAIIPTSTVLTVTGGKFATGEDVEIYMDDILVYKGFADSTTGEINFTFNVPDDIRAGDKEIQAFGLTSEAMGSTSFLAEGVQQRTAIIVEHHTHNIHHHHHVTKTVVQRIIQKVPISDFDRRYGNLPTTFKNKVKRILRTGYGSTKLWNHYQACMKSNLYYSTNDSFGPSHAAEHTFATNRLFDAGRYYVSFEAYDADRTNEISLRVQNAQRTIDVFARNTGNNVWNKNTGILDIPVSGYYNIKGKLHLTNWQWGMRYIKINASNPRSLAWCVKHDPLAQTFKLDEAGFVSSVDIWIDTKPTDDLNSVEVSIHNVKVGIPDREDVIVSKLLYPENITAGAWNKFTFDEPVYFEKNTEYALVVFTPDTSTTIRVAEIGAFDHQNNVWLSSQPYGVGVLLQSANRSSWAPIPKEDMTFRVNTKTFIGELDSVSSEPTGLQSIQLGSLSLDAVAEITKVAFAEAQYLVGSGSGEGYYFTIHKPIGNYFVWYNVDGNNTIPTDSVLAGYTGIQVAVVSTTDTAALVASKTATLITAQGFVVATVGNCITITNATGAAIDSSIGTMPSMFTVAVLQQGRNAQTGVTDLNLTANASILNEATVSYRAVLTGRDDEVVPLTPGKTTKINEYTSNDLIEIWADLQTTNDKVSPVLDGNVNVNTGLVNTTSSEYISKEFTIDGNDFHCYLDIFQPTNCTVKVYIQDGDSVVHWEELIYDSGESILLENGWVDAYYEGPTDCVLGVTETQIKIVMTSTDGTKWNRPYAENLRAYVT